MSSQVHRLGAVAGRYVGGNSKTGVLRSGPIQQARQGGIPYRREHDADSAAATNLTAVFEDSSSRDIAKSDDEQVAQNSPARTTRRFGQFGHDKSADC